MSVQRNKNFRSRKILPQPSKATYSQILIKLPIERLSDEIKFAVFGKFYSSEKKIKKGPLKFLDLL